jgi:ribonuclease P protein component
VRALRGTTGIPLPVHRDTASKGERFTREDRLHRRREFEAVYARGVRIPGRHFVLFILPNTVGRSRLGVTLSRKVGGAVVRNRARRRLREIFRRHEELRGGGLDIVVHGKPEIAGAAQDSMEHELMKGIARFHERAGGGSGGTTR